MCINKYMGVYPFSTCMSELPEEMLLVIFVSANHVKHMLNRLVRHAYRAFPSSGYADPPPPQKC